MTNNLKNAIRSKLSVIMLMNTVWRWHHNYELQCNNKKPKAKPGMHLMRAFIVIIHPPDDRCVGDRLDTQHPPIIFPVLLDNSVPTISHPLMLHDILFTLILFSRHSRRNSLQNNRVRLLFTDTRLWQVSWSDESGYNIPEYGIINYTFLYTWLDICI